MKRLNCLLTIVASFIAVACASSTVPDRFYSLVLAADEAKVAMPAESKREIVIVGPIALPSYLNQRGLVMQLGDNRVQTANHNYWAEPLDEAIAKVLVRDVTAMSGNLKAERDAGRWTATTHCRLRFEFDRFHATNNSVVVVSGRYWLLSDDATVSREFDLNRVLAADGYSAAVTMLRQTLHALALDVAKTLQENPQCAKSTD